MARAVGHVAVVGLGLIGSSIARAVKERLPDVAVTGHDASDAVRAEARALGPGLIADDLPGAVSGVLAGLKAV